MTNDANNPTRKHFRFPAFNDFEGVKIKHQTNAEVTPLFVEKEPPKQPPLSVPTVEKEPEQLLRVKEKKDLAIPTVNIDKDKSFRRLHKASTDKGGQTIKQHDELSRHRSNLPIYDEEERAIPGLDHAHRSNLFNGEKAAFARKKKDSPVSERASARTKTEQEKHELLASMTKPKDSFLLFDKEQPAFQAKNEADPTVHRFNGSEVKGLVEEELPAIEKTVKKAHPAKTAGRLDRSLKGLLDEDSHGIENSKFFNK
jgi:hypothetical protein